MNPRDRMGIVFRGRGKNPSMLCNLKGFHAVHGKL